LLGQGGFADVFLYQQRAPRRRVALKVLLAEVIGLGAIERLNAEADAMAELSSHPHIVTVYGSGLSDDGRPYLAMEYCPKPSLNVNFRTVKRSVEEVLAIGVQIAGAVETAHRAGIFHRDIKPANILVTQYDTPALTDFGIAVNLAAGDSSAEGLSVPWSPPEAFGSPPWAGPQSDVWGLAATVYSLLARRAPFEVPGANNKSAAQMDRIQRVPLTPLGRADAPASLDQVLATAMAKDPFARYATALAFGRALQGIQAELRFQPTRLVVEGDGPEPPPELPEEDDDAPATRLRSPLRIDPEGPASGQTAPGPGAAQGSQGAQTFQGVVPQVPQAPQYFPPGVLPSPHTASSVPGVPIPETMPEWTRHPIGGSGEVERTVMRGPAPSPMPGLTAPPLARPLVETPGAALAPDETRKKRLGIWIGAGLGVAALVAIAWFALSSGDPEATTGPSSKLPVAQNAGISDAPDPHDLKGHMVEEEAVFEWDNPDPAAGDKYGWALLNSVGEAGAVSLVDKPQVTVPANADGKTCVEVFVVRQGGRMSRNPARACVG
jgi:serine/threonine protein kinase